MGWSTVHLRLRDAARRCHVFSNFSSSFQYCVSQWYLSLSLSLSFLFSLSLSVRALVTLPYPDHENVNIVRVLESPRPKRQEKPKNQKRTSTLATTFHTAFPDLPRARPLANFGFRNALFTSFSGNACIHYPSHRRDWIFHFDCNRSEHSHRRWRGFDS